MVQNFHKAENIRQEERALKHARYFNEELKKMSRRDFHDVRVNEYSEELQKINARLSKLEVTENDALHKLQQSVNEHNRLQNLTFSGNISQQAITDSKRRLGITKEKAWLPQR